MVQMRCGTVEKPDGPSQIILADRGEKEFRDPSREGRYRFL